MFVQYCVQATALTQEEYVTVLKAGKAQNAISQLMTANRLIALDEDSALLAIVIASLGGRDQNVTKVENEFRVFF